MITTRGEVTDEGEVRLVTEWSRGVERREALEKHRVLAWALSDWGGTTWEFTQAEEQRAEHLGRTTDVFWSRAFTRGVEPL